MYKLYQENLSIKFQNMSCSKSFYITKTGGPPIYESTESNIGLSDEGYKGGSSSRIMKKIKITITRINLQIIEMF